MSEAAETHFRHVKRGTEYTELGQAQMQAAEPVREGELVDGRFEAVPGI